MRSFLLAICLCSMVFLTGCAILDKAFVPTYDEVGNEVSREPTETVKAVAGAIPYGDVAVNVALLLFAGVARFKQYKTEKGLKATLMAGKAISKDPKLKELWEKAKNEYYRPAHSEAGVTRLVKLLLAKM